ncbi:ABC transporter ATP-binding protein [Tessaracoccus aquimaris]|uniref:ABC transporter ATP-binding protein n=1 Tax=Tessaracoccus aquimaris TaxID=1332264 RepID=A0A1Q2CLF4_9ACTN|nr:ATP-binding cassette domain-containing protein [Tessaracoccus aquimaris]AQP46905.1 ABC transporter ATP-binding protein [Tessaracoccus aquimaris]
MDVPDLIRAQGVYVSIGGMPILRDVSLTVAAGEAVALLGGNGSGKSTLVRTLLGILPHQEGEITLFDQQVPGFRDWWKVGYVPQHSVISVPNATVREIASAGRLAHLKPFQWLSRSDRRIVDDCLEQVDLASRADWPFRSLSGGQKQRVLIARALTSEPRLLVMDEPLAGVDLHSQAGLAQLLGRLRDDGLGLLVVLHERGPMAAILNRSVTLCDGRIVEGDPVLGSTCADEESHHDPIGLSDPIAGSLT